MRIRNVSNIRHRGEALFAAIERCCLESQELAKSAVLAEFLGEFAYRNAVGRYQSLPIERHLYQLTRQLNVELPCHHQARDSNRQIVLHVMTAAYSRGGHTRVVERWCQAAPGSFENRIAITSQGEEPFPCLLSEVADDICLIERGGFVQRAQLLAQQLLAADVIVLHIHAHDVLPIIAAALVDLRSTPVAFYNHADHAFSFGYSISDRVYEISGFGYELSKKKKSDGLPRAYLGIPLQRSDARVLQGIESTEGYVVSAGTAYKYHPTGGLDFIVFAEELVEKIRRKFIVIGPDRTKEVAWQQVYERSKGLVDAIGILPHDAYIAKVRGAACYVDSFPMTGGSAFPEVLLEGVSVFALQLSCSGYSCLDVIRQPTTVALMDVIAEFFDGGDRAYNQQLSQLQTQLIALQGEQGFISRFSASLQGSNDALEGVPYPYSEQQLEHYEEGWQESKVLFIPEKGFRQMDYGTSLALWRVLLTNIGGHPGKLIRLLMDALRKK